MWLELVLIIISFFLSIPLLIISCELVISLLHKPLASNLDKEEFSEAYTILMPAHNEGSIIQKTLSVLVQQGVSVNNIVVVADNCTDSTAEISRKIGVTILERINDRQVGKGFALDYGIQFLKNNKSSDVIIILDADCEIDSKSLNLLTAKCLKYNLPTQALYLMRNKENDSLKSRVAGFAWLVKNKIRPIAIQKLGLPVTLTGTGMAFPWSVIANANVAHGNIVEDMQLGIDCTLDGSPPTFCEQAIVYSDFPEQAGAENTQRTRWEHGHLMTITQQVPYLIKQAVIQKDWRLLGLALDIGVPPLSLLVMISLVGLFILAVAGFIFQSFYSFFILLTVFLFFALMVIATWWQVGRDFLSFKEICSIPLYVFSKLSIYVAFIFNRQKSWVRTARDSND